MSYSNRNFLLINNTSLLLSQAEEHLYEILKCSKIYLNPPLESDFSLFIVILV